MKRVVVLAMAMTGCFYPAERGKLLEAKVDRLTAENESLQTQLKEQQTKLVEKIDAKIAEVQTALEGLDKAARRTDADIGVQLQKTMEDLAQLRGQTETYLHKLGVVETELKRIDEESAKKLTELQGKEAVKQAEAQKKADELERPKGSKEFLALADQKSKDDLGVARQLYTEFLKKWPKDDLTGEAHFGLGETFFREDKCREALGEYGQVIQKFSKTRSAPDAYLRSSDCFKKLKMNDESRLALEEVVKQFPKSDAAKKAKDRLDALKKKPVAGKKGASK